MQKLHQVLSWKITCLCMTLHWRHNDHDGFSNHQPHDCLFNRLFRRRSKKTSKLRVTGLCAGNSPGPVNSPHKRPVTRKMFPFDDVIMDIWQMWLQSQTWKMVMHVLTKYNDVEGLPFIKAYLRKCTHDDIVFNGYLFFEAVNGKRYGYAL